MGEGKSGREEGKVEETGKWRRKQNRRKSGKRREEDKGTWRD